MAFGTPSKSGPKTLYETAALALKSFRQHDCAPGPAAHTSLSR
jgi:hypothetical protein